MSMAKTLLKEKLLKSCVSSVLATESDRATPDSKNASRSLQGSLDGGISRHLTL